MDGFIDENSTIDKILKRKGAQRRQEEIRAGKKKGGVAFFYQEARRTRNLHTVEAPASTCIDDATRQFLSGGENFSSFLIFHLPLVASRAADRAFSHQGESRTDVLMSCPE